MDDFVSKRLQEICREKKKSCYQLSKETNISTSSLYSILNGRASPKVSTLEVICRALDITVGELFNCNKTADFIYMQKNQKSAEEEVLVQKIAVLDKKNRKFMEEILDLLIKYQ